MKESVEMIEREQQDRDERALKLSVSLLLSRGPKNITPFVVHVN